MGYLVKPLAILAAAVALLVLARRSWLSDGGPAPIPEPDGGLYVPMAAWPQMTTVTQTIRCTCRTSRPCAYHVYLWN